MSIRGKICAFLLLFCAVLLALLWLFQVVFLDGIYKQVKIAEVKSAMATLEANIDDVDSTADYLFQSRSINTTVLSSDGNVIYQTGGNMMRESIRELQRLYTLTVNDGGEFFEYPFSEPESEFMPFPDFRRQQNINYSKILSDGKLIFLSALITPVDATVSTLKLELYAITVIMLLFAVVIALLISRHVAKPIVSINNSAKILAKGKYDVQFTATGYKEIRELADTLTYAAGELNTVEELRKELIANISHDLRTPLTLIAGYAEAMRDLPGESTPENAQVVIDEVSRLNRLVSEVLNLSKYQSENTIIERVEYNITEQLRGIVSRLSEFTRVDGYVIELNAEHDVIVNADESAIAQALYNLITNAINYTGDDKTVKVEQLEINDSVVIEVHDSGSGITARELPHIWDRYYRSEKKHRRAVVGSGIGLSIVKSVMDKHNGEYGVDSQEGHGSTFWIKLQK